MEDTKARALLVPVSSRNRDSNKSKKRRRHVTLAQPSAKKLKPRRVSLREKIQMVGLGVLLLLAGAVGAELSVAKREVHTHGTIYQIDLNAHSFSITTAKEPKPVSIYWSENTDFQMDGMKAEASALQPSMKVTLWKKNSLFFPDKITRVWASKVK